MTLVESYLKVPIWQLHLTWYGNILAAVIIYILVFFIIRMMGKKQLSKLSPLELVLILIIGTSISTGIINNESNVGDRVIFIGTLIFLNSILHELTFRFSWFEKIIIGRPEVIILNGRLHRRILKKVRITETELFEAMREHEIMKTEDVKCAILEADGKISIIKYGIRH